MPADDLLVGGTDVAPQGGSLVMQPPATLTNGPDFTRLQTSTSGSLEQGGDANHRVSRTGRVAAAAPVS